LSTVGEALALALGTPASTTAPQGKMGHYLAQIPAQLPADQLAQLVGSIDPTVQAKLQAAFAQIQS
jgi:hypothetical protein